MHNGVAYKTMGPEKRRACCFAAVPCSPMRIDSSARSGARPLKGPLMMPSVTAPARHCCSTVFHRLPTTRRCYNYLSVPPWALSFPALLYPGRSYTDYQVIVAKPRFGHHSAGYRYLWPPEPAPAPAPGGSQCGAKLRELRPASAQAPLRTTRCFSPSTRF